MCPIEIWTTINQICSWTVYCGKKYYIKTLIHLAQGKNTNLKFFFVQKWGITLEPFNEKQEHLPRVLDFFISDIKLQAIYKVIQTSNLSTD